MRKPKRFAWFLSLYKFLLFSLGVPGCFLLHVGTGCVLFS